jgi:hypothetical protein
LADLKAILRRQDKMQAERRTWEDTWQQVSDYVLGRGDFQTTFFQGGRQRLDRIFDGTGLRAHQTFVALVSSLLTNPAAKWFLLSLANPELLQNRRVALWLQETQEHMQFVINRPQSGLQPQFHEMYNDLIGYGTGAVAVLDDPVEGLYYHSHNLQEIFIQEDFRGRVDTVHRQVEMTARQIEQKYPGKSKVAAKHIASNNEEVKLRVIQALFPNDDQHKGGFTNKPIASVHLLAADGNPELLREGGFHEMPILTPRWEKDSGEIQGRGPGIQALPDNKMAHEMSRTMLKAGQKAVDPALMISNRGNMSTVRTHAGGHTSVRFDGGTRGPIEVLESRAKFGIGLDLIKSRQSAIESAYHVDLLEIFRQPNMTATHVLEIVNQADRALSPVLGRQQTELLEPTVARSLMIEFRAGRLPEVPPELEGQEVLVEYQSPIARAQKASEKKALRDGLAGALEAAQTIPSILDNYDTDEIARMDWELGSLPVTGLRPREDVIEIREARAEQQAQQAQMEAALAAADTASKFQGGQA